LARRAFFAALAIAGIAVGWYAFERPTLRDPADVAADRGKPPLRVLFVGNSYTFVNHAPSLVRSLATAAGERLRFEAVEECPGGSHLRDHWSSGRDPPLLLAGHFDWMVLQEQGQIPSFAPAQRERDMYPYVEQLQATAARMATKTLLFGTWARRDGDPSNVPGDTYEAMQARADEGYAIIARRLSLPVAPVGLAWRKALATGGLPTLWAEDGTHPSVAGSYLAACVLYQRFYGHDAVGNRFEAGLGAETAGVLQRVAAEAVREYEGGG
jgi:hypothetical protein